MSDSSASLGQLGPGSREPLHQRRRRHNGCYKNHTNGASQTGSWNTQKPRTCRGTGPLQNDFIPGSDRRFLSAGRLFALRCRFTLILDLGNNKTP